MSYDSGDSCEAEVGNAGSSVLIDEDVRLQRSVRGVQISDPRIHVHPSNPHGQCGGHACGSSRLRHQPAETTNQLGSC